MKKRFIKLLLKNGADLESKTKIGQTPISLAAENGHRDVVQLLLNYGANFESKDNYGQTVWAATSAVLEGKGGKHLGNCQIVGPWESSLGMWGQGYAA